MRLISTAIASLQAAGVERMQYPFEYLASLEVAVQGALPRDYRAIVTQFGPFILPGEPTVEIYDPARICAYVGSIFNMSECLPHAWPVIPIARIGNSGDDLGFLRSEREFAPGLVLLDHEGPWTKLNENWHSEVANSLSSFLVSRLEGR